MIHPLAPGGDGGPGWDVGEIPARPMPYFIFPENKDVVAVQRDQADYMSADYKDSLKREVA